MTHTGYGAEERLLLCCARAQPCGAELAQLSGQVADWDRVLLLAAHHGLNAFLFAHLKDQAPAPVESQLRSRARGVSMVNLTLTAEMLRVVAAFQAAGIPVLPFKGPVLAATLYGDRALREFSDVDLLVHAGDVARAVALLGKLGFEGAGGVEQGFWECGRQRPLLRTSTGAAVDLHWGLMPKGFAGDTGDEGLWERCGRLRLGSREVPTLGMEDLVHFLCVHGTKHLWGSLDMVCDVAGALRVCPAMDWSAVMAQARRSGTRRAVLLGLQLAHELLDAETPAHLLQAAKMDPAVQGLAARSVADMFREPPTTPSAWARMRYAYRVSERWRERCWLVRGTLFELTPADGQAFSLPRALHPLYRVIRPFRLLWKHSVGRLRGRRA